ncbi:MAG: Pseudouridine synthase [Lachnoclostridium sp.]|jgi:23S rRNA pseudouridine955/2504/2580 synthase
MKIITVDKNEAGQRLDKLLMKYLNKAPKSFIYKMLRKKNITLNGKKASGSEKTQLNDEIKLFLSDETIQNFSEAYKKVEVKYDFTVVYEDADILLVNKPAGLLSQKAGKDDISLVEHIHSYLLNTNQIREEELNTFKPGICNRLDRNTSGLVAAGKTLAGLQVLSELFRERTLDKYYLCIVKGMIKEGRQINGYLRKDEKSNKVSVTGDNREGGEPIRTEYKPVQYNSRYTLLCVKLITGKTHQIRAHLSSIGHPVIGDSKYGNKEENQKFKKDFGLKYQLLHSYQIGFPDLTGKFEYLSGKVFTAPLPDYFTRIQKELF